MAHLFALNESAMHSPLNRFRIARLALTLSFLAYPMMFGIVLLLQLDIIWFAVGMLVSCGPVATAWLFYRHKMAHAWRFMESREWLICDHCDFDLRGSESKAVCPECGTPFTREGLALTWSSRLAGHTK